MATHLGLLVLFSLGVSVVFAHLNKDDPREQLQFAAVMFAGFVLAGVVLGWLMYPLPL
jgi:heme/copper-type cytochrome/quinol oxidase subunit 4